jgi:hypothetical protein
VLTSVLVASPDASPVSRHELSTATLASADLSNAPLKVTGQIHPALPNPTSNTCSPIGGQGQQYEDGLECIQKRDKQDAPWGNGLPPTVTIAPFPGWPGQINQNDCAVNWQLLTRMIDGWVKSLSSSRARGGSFDWKSTGFGIQGGACVTTSFKGPADQLPMYKGQTQAGGWPAPTNSPNSWENTPAPSRRSSSSSRAWSSNSLPQGSRSWGGISEAWGGSDLPRTTVSTMYPPSGDPKEPDRGPPTSTVFVTIPLEPTSTYVTFR